ncbi:MAG: sigma-70 family RNA polymerase sigma factor [Candidatus Rokubacteria bacterium]|nr:sigma-70 family RNA polymerase sigma factor [Candidatus Rokubacteria bacterium]
MALSEVPLKEAADAELLEWLRAGDERGVEQLVNRYGGWIYRVARRLLHDPRDVEEVTQDVLLTVVRKIQTFRGEAAFSSWLYRIAVNAAYQRLRSKRTRPEVPLEPFLPVFDEEGRLAEPVADWSAPLDDPAVAAEARTAIERAIAELPPDYRTAVVLRDVEGLSNAEVAEILGLSLPAVKSRVHRTRLALRGRLERYFADA